MEAGMTEGSVEFVEPHELDLLIGQETVTVIDVREANEFATGHIETAINIPTSNFDIPALIDLTDENDTDLVFVCAVGQRSFGAANAVLPHVDCKVINLKGGIQSWTRGGFELEGGK
jgi:rhodanese-related sulfurtransferase|tara:strand:+ start:3215 stop:3565 length:351 start_codon:yes stop_codon:yes gene_type:complete